MIDAPSLTQWVEASRSISPTAALICAGGLVLAVLLVLRRAVAQRLHTLRSPRLGQAPTKEKSAIDDKDNARITPLDTFDIAATPPLPLRPFLNKPVYHLTMATQSCAQEDLYVLDNEYLSRIREREQILEAHSDDVACTTKHAGVRGAVDELYTTIVRHHLPQRFPTVFQRCNAIGDLVADAAVATHLKIVPDNGRLVPLEPSSDPVETLRTLGTISDDDHIILFPSPCKPFSELPAASDEPDTTYTAHAMIFCCPAGFSPSRSVLGNPLAIIHRPVPGFAQKLQRSMDRFFARLEYLKPVRRANWTIVAEASVYTPEGAHMYKEPESRDEKRAAQDEAARVKPAESFLRVERQTLQRLPASGAIVFSLKTYLTPLPAVRAEGHGAELATAAEGLRHGNVPGMWLYKRGPVWGERVCEYLRAAAD